MNQRKLGTQGLSVSALGLGWMGMSEFYGPCDAQESIATIQRALALGVTLLDTADMYGCGENERLVGRAIKGRRREVILATKFGNVRDQRGNFLGLNGAPEYVCKRCDASLRRLAERGGSRWSACMSNSLHARSVAIQWLRDAARADGRRRFYTMYSLVVICIHYVIMETWHRITKKGCCGLSARWGCSDRVTCNRRAFHESIWPNLSSRANC